MSGLVKEEPYLFIAFDTAVIIRMYSKIYTMQVHCLKSVFKYQSYSLSTVAFASLFLVADKDTNIGVAIEMIYVVKTYASY